MIQNYFSIAGSKAMGRVVGHRFRFWPAESVRPGIDICRADVMPNSTPGLSQCTRR